MQSRHPLAILALLLLAVACEDGNPLGPDVSARADHAPSGPPIIVLTRNLYVGADLDAVITALLTPDPGDDVAAFLGAITNLQLTDFTARAEALADEIAQSGAVAVGLQEVSTLEVPTQAGPLVIDFWPILQAALVSRGVSYDPVASVVNIDLVVPAFGARLVDRDLLLVRRGISVRTSASGSYAADLALGFTTLRRGWVAADIWLAGKTVRIVSTHLESGAGLPGLVREAQAAELVATLTGVEGPTIVMGDLNDEPGSAAYNLLVNAGFVDTWPATHPADAGFTCCHAPDLANGAATFTKRIDYILVRGGFLTGTGSLVGGTHVELVGEEPGDRVAGPVYPIWPSDHAGLVASFPPAR